MDYSLNVQVNTKTRQDMPHYYFNDIKVLCIAISPVSKAVLYDKMYGSTTPTM
jgi:hypothetical protein